MKEWAATKKGKEKFKIVNTFFVATVTRYDQVPRSIFPFIMQVNRSFTVQLSLYPPIILHWSIIRAPQTICADNKLILTITSPAPKL